MVNFINNVYEKWSSVGLIIRDIKTMLGKLKDWLIRHIQRNVNNVAHVLDKSALVLSYESILL